MSEIHHWSAIETAAKIRRRAVSVAEVTQAHLDRIAAVNPALNAVPVAVTDAMDVAHRLDAEGPSDSNGPLWGVPVTMKINADQSGYANSNGLPALAENVGAEDSAVAANFKSGGAVIIARSNTPEFSLRWCTSNPLHGVTKNPWNATITPGGSSGGAAAAVASGIGAVAHGNDLGGSLRYPAFCCGVATIRPSMGRVPAFNPSQTAERPPVTQMLSVQGPIARSIPDVRAGLQVMSARDSRDALYSTAADSGRTRTDTITVGYAVNPFNAPLDPAIETAMQKAVQAARDAGHKVREITPPHADEAAALWGDILFTETNLLMADAITEYGSAPLNQLVTAYANRYRQMDLPAFLTAMQRRFQLQRAWALMFDTVDVLLLPTSLGRPFENDLDFTTPNRIPEIIDMQMPLFVVNLLGLPAAALPTHLADGLPVGVQMIGPMHDDWFVLDVAETLEKELGPLWPKLNLGQQIPPISRNNRDTSSQMSRCRP